MAKKTPVKKSKRRLKRSVRRSLAAVLMITAIGVAAVPVPENYADEPMAVAEEIVGYEKDEDLTIGESGYAYTKPSSPDKEKYSFIIYEGGLYWQYRIDTGANRVLQYNASYPAGSLTLSDKVPTNYQYVLISEFNDFVTGANSTYTVDQDTYYNSDKKEARDFFAKYFAEDDEYKQFLVKLNNSENAEFTRGVSDLLPEDQRKYYCNKKLGPGLYADDFTLEYVSVNIGNSAADLKAKNQMEEAKTGAQDASNVYVPKYIGTDSTGQSFTLDSEGYLVYSDNTGFSNIQDITSIGNFAFAGNGSLRSIELPNRIRTIGIGAFMDCTYLTSVNIPFLSEITKGAFKNCNSLRTVNWWSDEGGSELTTIGREAFYGTGIAENVSGQGILRFPGQLSQIGDAAFYGNGALTRMEFDTPNNGGASIEIGNYAFFDNTVLSSVEFSSKKVENMGDYCFAVGVQTNAMNSFTFPDYSFKTGKSILANRTNLTQITVPANVRELKKDVLAGCTGLQVAKFLGGATTYEKELFQDVMQDGFYVTGPARQTANATTDDIKDASGPRKSTWKAEKTAAGNYIPYLYTIGGKEYYEICSDGYLESIDKATGTLTNCDLMEDATVTNGELIIPDKVGDTLVTSIASDCFKGKTRLANSVVRLVIGNNLMAIGDSVFDSWTKLLEVEIGKSIQTIGSGAFANCTSLQDITFATPDSYETLSSIGTNAFATKSGKLVIHGDIVDGYLPFEYAMNPNNYVEDVVTIGAPKRRILYQSRWDSPSSKHMSVMYGEYDDGNGYVTLIDYPLHKDFYSPAGDGTFKLSADLEAHNRDMERQYYAAYGNYSYPTDEDRYLVDKIKFAYEYVNAGNAEDVYNNDKLYGPWVNPSFCANYKEWTKPEWLEKAGITTADDSGYNKVLDWFFTPMTVQAAEGTPKAYFDHNPYNFLANYDKYGGDRNLIQYEYKDGWTFDEQAMIEAVNKIVIPEGIESIDLAGFYASKVRGQQNAALNQENYDHYFGAKGYNRGNTFVDYTRLEDTGLFSGENIDDLYDDKGTIDQGKNRRGNDRITSVDMSQSNVKWIPDYAFDNCELLYEVLIPASCTTTGALPFRDCGKMKVLTSDSENVPALNGILYQKKEDATYELVECILGKGMGDDANDKIVRNDLDDPYISLVSSIGESAFENCQGIQQVILDCIDGGSSANKLKLIPDNCFRNCDALTDVVLPESAKEVGQYAFADIREKYCHSTTTPSKTPRLNVTIRGREFNISETAFDPKGNGPDTESTICMVTIHTYPDTAAERYALEQIRKNYHIDLDTELSTRIRVNFWDWNGDTLCDTIYLEEGVNRLLEENIPAEVTAIVTEPNHRPGYEFKGWLGYGGAKVGEAIKTDEITYIAQYESDGTMINGQYRVQFLDGLDGHQLRGYGASKDGNYYVDVGKSFSEMGIDEGDEEGEGWDAPDYADHSDEGFQFLTWSNDWTRDTKINKNMTIVALYEYKPTSGGSTNTPGTGSSGGSTNTPGAGGTTSGTTTSSSTNTTSSSTSSSSTSTSSTSSGSDSTVGKYTVTVINGSGSGNYDVGSTVVIAANEPAAGMVFQKWTTESNGVALASVSLPATTFIMPANNVTVTAEFVAGANNITGAVGTPAGNTGTTNNGSTNTGNTRVDITKPGISNRDLATANVNGSTDNFIVKITETDEATRAVQDALTNKYGSLENLLYYAMDISLYDSTGTVKISDTTGLSVDITIPIPDALVAYGGNNMAGAVINGNQLENLNESFTTINGVPCIRFRATHFSPYTVYVDTGNLTEGMLDTTPKTGDPIHPKWFLSIGLACLSVILFMKKDKAVKVKTA